MTPPRTVPTRVLLEESVWLRRLARRLLRDDASADDAVQDTLTAALHRERDGRVPGRRWLGSVLRNVVRMGQRSSMRRGDREAHAAIPATASVPAADELSARLEVQRRLVEAVSELDEPYRTTVALRFLEDLPAREVARRMDVPVKTVQSRIDRALVRLRERLDRTFGERGAWSLALADLARPLLFLGPNLGVLAMGTGIKWVGAAAGLVVVGLLLNETLGGEDVTGPEHTSVAPVVAPDLAEVPSELASTDQPPGGMRATVESIDVPIDEPMSEVAAIETFEGRVIDLVGNPAVGVTAVFEPTRVGKEEMAPLEERVAISDGLGVFHMPLQTAGRGRLTARGAGLATVIAPGLARTPPPEPPVIVVGPEMRYSGIVVDVDGARISGMELVIGLPADEAARLAPGAYQAIVPVVRVKSDAEGEFIVEAVGFVQGMTFDCHEAGYRYFSMVLPGASATDLVVVLEPSLDPKALAGIVVDYAGMPVADAYVSTGSFSTLTDEEGGFLLEAAAVSGTEIRAAKEGHLPARLEFDSLAVEERGELVLTLGPEPHTIAGLVIDAAGDPVPNAVVWSFDAERFGQHALRFGEIDFIVDVDTEGVLAGNASGDGCVTRSDEHGRFELPGLLERTYTVYAMDPLSLTTGVRPDIPAGARGMTLRLESGGVPVAGRVVNYGGAPLEGVTVNALRWIDAPDGLPRLPVSRPEREVTTDADGRFRFDPLVVRGTQLQLSRADSDMLKAVKLEAERDYEAIEIRVPAPCHLRVLMQSDPALADTMVLLNAEGDSLPMTTMLGTVSIGAMAMGLEDGTSGLISTDESARTLLLYKEEEEVRRVGLELVAGEVNEVVL